MRNHVDNTEIVTMIHGIIGACAWLLEVWKMLLFRHTKLEATVLDVMYLKKFTLFKYKKERKRLPCMI